MLNGVPYDAQYLRANTTARGNPSVMAPRRWERQLKIFWAEVEKLDPEDLRSFVKFWTGGEALPKEKLILTLPAQQPGSIQATTCAWMLALPGSFLDEEKMGLAVFAALMEGKTEYNMC